MFISIYFCTDGIIRAKYNEEALIPMQFIQQHSNEKDDFSFWSKWWKSPVHFEKGLTLINFFKCIEPWNNFFSTLTDVDIALYLQEMKKPCDIEKQTHMDYIEISKNIFLEPEIKYLDTLDITEIMAIINARGHDSKKRPAQLTGLWHCHTTKSIHTFLLGNNIKYAFTLAHPEVMANLPIILNAKQAIYISHNLINKFTDEQCSLFSQQLPSVISNSDHAQILMTEISYCFREVIEMFFSSIDKTPQINRDFMNMLHERVKSHQDYLDSISKDNVIEQSTIDHNINVIAINTGKPIVSDNHVVEKEEDTININTSSHFINDLGHIQSPEQELWHFLLEKASQDNIILRIGKIEEQLMPELRVMGNITSEDNYIHASEKKNI